MRLHSNLVNWSVQAFQAVIDVLPDIADADDNREELRL